jgi:DNA recombination protein RmuC
MNYFLILIIIGLTGLVSGIIAGYVIHKAKSDKIAAGLKAELENERRTSENVGNELRKTANELQNEQKERVKFETQYSGLEKRLQELKEEIEELNKRNVSLQEQFSEIKAKNSELSAKYQESLKSIEEQKRFVNEANEALRDAFKSLSSDALKNNNESFLNLAKTVLEKHITESKTDIDKRQQAIDSLVKPLGESLTKLDGKIQEIEKVRQGAYSEVKILVEGMKGTAEKLQKDTNSLVTALKTSHVRGKYGEIGLKRIVEFAGMSEFCDFQEQVSVNTEDGRLRPDFTVYLPEKRQIIIDSKVPLDSYIQAFETTDENEKINFLKKHASAVRNHLKKLSEKAYWSQFKDSPDYVILYLQIESSFGAALEYDRTLIEDGMNNKIIFAVPTTLISMLKTIAFSWQQVKIAENIYQIRDAGVELYNRATTLRLFNIWELSEQILVTLRLVIIKRWAHWKVDLYLK